MTKSYKTSTKTPKVLTFDLDDREFTFTAPKMSGLILQIAEKGEAGGIAGLLNWLSDGLTEEDNDFIIERLRDPDDPLDFDVVQEIVEDLMAAASNRPTKPRRASSR